MIFDIFAPRECEQEILLNQVRQGNKQKVRLLVYECLVKVLLGAVEAVSGPQDGVALAGQHGSDCVKTRLWYWCVLPIVGTHTRRERGGKVKSGYRPHA